MKCKQLQAREEKIRLRKCVDDGNCMRTRKAQSGYFALVKYLNTPTHRFVPAMATEMFLIMSMSKLSTSFTLF